MPDSLIDAETEDYTPGKPCYPAGANHPEGLNKRCRYEEPHNHGGFDCDKTCPCRSSTSVPDLMTAAERAGARGLAEKATPGPWEANFTLVTTNSASYPGDDIAMTRARSIGGNDDAAFIAAARTALPRALDLLDAQEKAIREALLRINRPEVRASDLARAVVALSAVLGEGE